MGTIQVLSCLVLSVSLKYFSTFLLRLVQAHSDAARDGAIAFGIALILSFLYILLPPPEFTDALADSVESSLAAFLLPLYRLNPTLHRITIALRPGTRERDADTRVYPAPMFICTLTPLSPLLRLLERLAVLPREPVCFVAFVVSSSTVTVPLLGPNLVLALLTSTHNTYAKQVAAVLEMPVLLAVAALLFLQLRLAMRLFRVARDVCRETDPKRRARVIDECIDFLPSFWDWRSWQRCWRE